MQANKRIIGAVLILAGLLAAMAALMCTGCGPVRWVFGIPGPPAAETPADNSVKDSVGGALDAASGSGDKPVEGDTFPYRRFVGFCFVGLSLAGTCLLFGPTKHLARFALVGGVLLGTVAVIKLMFWDLLLGVAGLGILGGFVVGLLWLIERHRRAQSDKIADVQMDAIENAEAAGVKKRISGKAALAGVDAELDKRLEEKGFKKK